MPMTGVLRPGHAQLRVLDMEESVHFYTNVLGLKETGRDKSGRVYFKAWDERDHNSVILRQAERAGMDFFGSGNITQLDAVDESTNITSLLLWLAENGAIGYHSIYSPYWQTGLVKMRYAALIYDRKHKVSWAIDSNLGVNGEEPLVMELEKWRVR